MAVGVEEIARTNERRKCHLFCQNYGFIHSSVTDIDTVIIVLKTDMHPHYVDSLMSSIGEQYRKASGVRR